MKLSVNPLPKQNINRDCTFDILKIYAMLSVVLDHTLKRWIQGITYTQLYNYIFISQMPIFMFVSGFFMYKNLKIKLSWLDFLKKMAKCFLGFIVPFISFSLINTLIKGQPNQILSNLFDAFLHPGNSLWFLWVLMWMEVLMITAQRITLSLKQYKKVFSKLAVSFCLYAVFLLPVFVVYIKFPNYFDTKLMLYYSVFFCFGIFFNYLMGIFKDKLSNGLLWLIAIVSLITISIILFLHPCFLYEDENIINVLSRIAVSIAAIIGVWSIASLLSKREHIRKLSIWGKFSLELYYVHLLLLSVAFLHEYLDSSLYILTILEFIGLYVLVILISFIFIFIIKSNHITDFIIFGKIPSKEKK